MREPREILARLRALGSGEIAGAQGAAIATIVAVEGSSYRREGARLLIELDGRMSGVLSGGCVEREIVAVAAEVAAAAAPRTVVYDLTGENEAIWGFGLGCEGRVTLLVEPLTGPGGAALERAFGAAIEERREVRIATVYSTSASPVPVGERHEYKDSIEGKDQVGWRRAARAQLKALLPGSARSARLADGDGAFVEALLESIVPPVKLIVLGAERDVVPLARLGAELGWEIVVADARGSAAAAGRFSGLGQFVVAPPRALRSEPALAVDLRTAVVVATHRYLDDLAYLGELAALSSIDLPEGPGYLGLLGPARRRERLLDDLARQGHALHPSFVRGPAGLALGGRAPEEVALAIVAEIQAAFAGGVGASLTSAAGEVVAAGASAIRESAPPSPIRR